MELAREERADFTAYVSLLTPSQWQAPTLCDGWSVHDLVAHVVSYEELGLGALAARFLRGRLSPDRINALGVEQYGSCTPDDLVEMVRRHVSPRGLTAGFGGAIALTDTVIHHQDIRLALGHNRTIPPARLQVALPFAMVAPPIRGAWTTRKLRVVATDLDWAFGWGPEVRGSAQALLMAVAGRSATLDELTGPGLDTLRRRIR